MNDKFFDLQSARSLFSKAQQVSFRFAHKPEFKNPSIYLLFPSQETRQVKQILLQLSEVLKKELLKLSIDENGGDFLSVSFLWESRGINFSSSPDRYSKRECRDFRQNVHYGDKIKLFFCIEVDGNETFVKANKDSIEISDLNCVYYQYTA